ncbi:SDR family oxidoreductase [Teichococcus vastitatis]|jgi:NAD(P)-dependent dehydrogenase (short-subunit alcohol dehydrogenase family)|uniref:SDR family oxidoreductase n=1 Tax=Teichococcus vastitatis TaxID=2307076 RepID=A0ABS9VZ19_9PROT|nr:SDR family oxidoreductase [Pseudoroseomonas vastitatis]MCI0752225.1 SDR family oxidoreductase [Pseudoroseomonas vastitatis]
MTELNPAHRKVVVVTGGTMGIGRATAQAFARQGWAVAVLARGEERLRSTEAELKDLGVPALGIAADVSDAQAMDAAAARIERELGPIEAWVNNAMATVITPVMDITPEELRRVTDVTYHGQVFGTLAALRRMKPRNRGAIIQVSSGLGLRAAPLQSAYCAAKQAVQGFTDALRSELLHDGSAVTLTVVYLPAVNTPQFRRTRNHMGQAQNAPDPVFDPRLCANAILSAVQQPVREVWVGRSTLQMAAAQALVPGFADRKAGEMWDAQLDPTQPPPDPEGNLFEPKPGDPGIDGPFTDRVKPGQREFVTSRTRDAVVATVAGLSLVGLAALAAPAVTAMALHQARQRGGGWPVAWRRQRGWFG